MDIENLVVNNQIIKSVDHAQALFNQKDSTKRMYVYHTGSLPNDRILNQRLDRLAKFLLIKAETGKCHLFQKRVDNSNSFYYLCQY